MDKINEDLDAIINAINELEKIYIVTDLPTPENVISQLSLIKSSAIMLLNDIYQIKQLLNEAKKWESLINGAYELQDRECAERANNHRQLAEWLTELKEAKRLLRLAVEDLNEIISTRHDNAQWRYADEALKLIGRSENEKEN